VVTSTTPRRGPKKPRRFSCADIECVITTKKVEIMGRTTVWTNREREFLYSYLLTGFGPYRNWHARANPHGNKALFETVLKEIAERLSDQANYRFTTKAVQQQLEWAITTQQKVNRRHIRSFLLNKAAAVEVGFLDADDLLPWFPQQSK
jgi:hypothetical protein